MTGASLCPHVADEKIEAMSEPLEHWTIIVCSPMLSIVALGAVAAAAGTELFFGTFIGRTTVVIELDDAPLVLRNGCSEVGADCPVGTKPISKL